jgi:ubiquitin C-terminal hydrolase
LVSCQRFLIIVTFPKRDFIYLHSKPRDAIKRDYTCVNNYKNFLEARRLAALRAKNPRYALPSTENSIAQNGSTEPDRAIIPSSSISASVASTGATVSGGSTAGEQDSNMTPEAPTTVSATPACSLVGSATSSGHLILNDVGIVAKADIPEAQEMADYLGIRFEVFENETVLKELMCRYNKDVRKGPAYSTVEQIKFDQMMKPKDNEGAEKKKTFTNRTKFKFFDRLRNFIKGSIITESDMEHVFFSVVEEATGIKYQPSKQTVLDEEDDSGGEDKEDGKDDNEDDDDGSEGGVKDFTVLRILSHKRQRKNSTFAYDTNCLYQVKLKGRKDKPWVEYAKFVTNDPPLINGVLVDYLHFQGLKSKRPIVDIKRIKDHSGTFETNSFMLLVQYNDDQEEYWPFEFFTENTSFFFTYLQSRDMSYVDVKGTIMNDALYLQASFGDGKTLWLPIIIFPRDNQNLLFALRMLGMTVKEIISAVPGRGRRENELTITVKFERDTFGPVTFERRMLSSESRFMQCLKEADFEDDLNQYMATKLSQELPAASSVSQTTSASATASSASSSQVVTSDSVSQTTSASATASSASSSQVVTSDDSSVPGKHKNDSSMPGKPLPIMSPKKRQKTSLSTDTLKSLFENTLLEVVHTLLRDNYDFSVEDADARSLRDTVVAPLIEAVSSQVSEGLITLINEDIRIKQEKEQQDNLEDRTIAMPDDEAGAPIVPGPDAHLIRNILGLENNSNKCYMNASLQCLMRVDPITEFVLSSGSQAPHCAGTGSREGYEIGTLYNQYHSFLTAYKSQREPINAETLIPVPGILKPAFLSQNQEDAEEYLTFFLELLHADTVKSSIVPKTFQFTCTYAFQCTYRKCNTTWNNTAPMQAMILSLPRTQPDVEKFCTYGSPDTRKAKQTLSLHNLLSAFTIDPETVTVHCSTCKRSRQCLRRMYTQRDHMSDVLIIQLKRFSYLGANNQEALKKNGVEVDFPTELDIGPYMEDNKDPFLYDLFGIICHEGPDARSGHYYATTRNYSREAEWVLFNDRTTSTISTFDSKYKTDAYILFYKKR